MAGEKVGREQSKKSTGGGKFKPLTDLTATFLEENSFLKKFLAGFLPAQQDIEDVAQEAFLRAFVFEQREAIEQPKAFLFRVARNLALSRLSKKSRQITEYIEEASSSAVAQRMPGADLELEAQQTLGLYCEAVAALPDKCRQVFLFRKVHGLSHKEIAARMGLTVSSIEKYMKQGVLACQNHIRSREKDSACVGSSPPDLRQENK